MVRGRAPQSAFACGRADKSTADLMTDFYQRCWPVHLHPARIDCAPPQVAMIRGQEIQRPLLMGPFLCWWASGSEGQTQSFQITIRN